MPESALEINVNFKEEQEQSITQKLKRTPEV